MDETQVSGPVRKRFRIRGDKQCAVCGDKALAHHFGVLACESCKAFFRRNAQRQLAIKPCVVEKACQMDKNSRRSCSWCRLSKCFAVGMKPELILDESQKKDLLEKVKLSRLKRQMKHTLSPACTEGGSSSASLLDRPSASPKDHILNDSDIKTTPNGHEFKHQIQQNLELDLRGNNSEYADIVERSFCKAGMSINSNTHCLSKVPVPLSECDASQYPGADCHLSQEDASPLDTGVSCTPQQSVSLNSCQCTSVSGEDKLSEDQAKLPMVDLTLLTRDGLPSDPQMYRRLSEDERMLLTFLSTAYEETMLVNLTGRQCSIKLDASNYCLNDYLSDCETQVRNAADFVKGLEDFEQLSFSDRIACFKASVSPALLIRNSYIFVVERTTWLMMKGELTFDIYKSLFPDNPYVMTGMEQNRKLKSLAKNDTTIYALIHCIFLFYPGMENIGNRQLVSAIQGKYVMLLRQYIEATFSFEYSEHYLKELQEQMVLIRELIKAHTKFDDQMCSISIEDLLPYKLLHALRKDI